MQCCDPKTHYTALLQICMSVHILIRYIQGDVAIDLSAHKWGASIGLMAYMDGAAIDLSAYMREKKAIKTLLAN